MHDEISEASKNSEDNELNKHLRPPSSSNLEKFHQQIALSGFSSPDTSSTPQQPNQGPNPMDINSLLHSEASNNGESLSTSDNSASTGQEQHQFASPAQQRLAALQHLQFARLLRLLEPDQPRGAMTFDPIALFSDPDAERPAPFPFHPSTRDTHQPPQQPETFEDRQVQESHPTKRRKTNGQLSLDALEKKLIQAKILLGKYREMKKHPEAMEREAQKRNKLSKIFAPKGRNRPFKGEDIVQSEIRKAERQIAKIEREIASRKAQSDTSGSDIQERDDGL